MATATLIRAMRSSGGTAGSTPARTSGAAGVPSASSRSAGPGSGAIRARRSRRRPATRMTDDSRPNRIRTAPNRQPSRRPKARQVSLASDRKQQHGEQRRQGAHRHRGRPGQAVERRPPLVDEEGEHPEVEEDVHEDRRRHGHADERQREGPRLAGRSARRARSRRPAPRTPPAGASAASSRARGRRPSGAAGRCGGTRPPPRQLLRPAGRRRRALIAAGAAASRRSAAAARPAGSRAPSAPAR